MAPEALPTRSWMLDQADIESLHASGGSPAVIDLSTPDGVEKNAGFYVVEWQITQVPSLR